MEILPYKKRRMAIVATAPSKTLCRVDGKQLVPPKSPQVVPLPSAINFKDKNFPVVGDKRKRDGSAAKPPAVERPSDISELMKCLEIGSESPLHQLENLLQNPTNSSKRCLKDIEFPTSAQDFTTVEKLTIPKFLLVKNDKYVRDEQKKPISGAFGTVAFYNRENSESMSEDLPERIAVKFAIVKQAQLLKLIKKKHFTQRISFSWVREFVVQHKLEKRFEGDSTEKPFVQVFAAGIFIVEEKIQVATAMQCGDCDLFDFLFAEETGRPDVVQKNVDMQEIVDLLASAAKSLAELHELNLQVGDVKPNNILVVKAASSGDNQQDVAQQKRAVFFDFDGAAFTTEKNSATSKH